MRLNSQANDGWSAAESTSAAVEADYRNWTVLLTGGSGFVGMNLGDHLVELGCAVVNADIRTPVRRRDLPMWRCVDVTNAFAIEKLIDEITPTHIVHLAARVDVAGRSLADYRTNTVGTDVIVKAAERSGRIQQFLLTSTQFVCQPGYIPQHDTDFAPHTAYGASKAAAELRIREVDPSFSWAIIRPTTLWGPGDGRYRSTFYKLVRHRLYVHPRGIGAHRSYGYIGNAVQQIRRLLELGRQIHGEVYYIGDPVADLTLFVDAIACAFTGKPARRIRPAAISGFAKVGDILEILGVPTPITSARYRSMTEDYWVPIDKTLDVTGPLPYSLRTAAAATVLSMKKR